MLIRALMRLSSQSDDPLLARVAGGARTAFNIRIIGIFLGFVLQLLVTRWFGAEVFGQYIYVLTWITILALFAKVGLDSASLRFVSAYHSTRQLALLGGFVKRGRQITIVASVFIAAIGAIVVFLLRQRIESTLAETFWMGLALLPAMSQLHVSAAHVQALKFVRQAQFPQNVVRPLILICGAGLLFLIGIRATAASLLAVELVAIGTALILVVRAHYRLIARDIHVQPQYQTKKWIVTAFPMMLISGAQLGLAKADIVMVGIFLGPLTAGKYAIASLVAGLAILPIQTANTIIAPTIAEFFAQQRFHNLQRITSFTVEALTLVTLPIVLILVIYGIDILGFFGEDFKDQYGTLLVLLIGNSAIVVCGSVGFLLSMTGNQTIGSWVIGSSLAVNLILNFVLIPMYGVLGAAIATSTSLGLRSLILSAFVWKRLNVMPTLLGAILFRLSGRRRF